MLENVLLFDSKSQDFTKLKVQVYTNIVYYYFVNYCSVGGCSSVGARDAGMSVGKGAVAPPSIFIHGTDKVEGG